MRVVILALLVVILSGCRRNEPLPKLWPIPEFTLIERSGDPFHSTSLTGKVWIADFFFASCPGVCPLLSARMAAVQAAFAGDDRVRFISITTDPANDTPQVLRGYASRFRAGPQWFFLTGKKDDIWKLSHDGFKLVIADSPGEAEPITHATRLALIDRTGTARGFYDGTGGESADRIIADIRRLLAE